MSGQEGDRSGATITQMCRACSSSHGWHRPLLGYLGLPGNKAGWLEPKQALEKNGASGVPRTPTASPSSRGQALAPQANKYQ